MKTVTLKEARREQFRRPSAHFEQCGNIVFGLLRLMRMWSLTVIVSTGGLAMVAYLAFDLSGYSPGALKAALSTLVMATGLVAAGVGLTVNAGRFRNVFNERAEAEVRRFSELRREIELQRATTDSLLIQYGLIKADTADQRRADSSNKRAAQ